MALGLMRETLQEIGLRCGTAKATHTSYLPWYERFLEPLRDQPIHLLELGVHQGHSLRMWLEYFTQATIHGLDHDLTSKYLEPFLEHPHCRLYQADQCDEERLNHWFESGSLDLVIDDAGHDPVAQERTVEILFPRVLKPGGRYFVEDVLAPDDLWRFEHRPGFEYHEGPGNYDRIVTFWNPGGTA